MRLSAYWPHPDVVGDDHHGEEADQRGQQQAVDEDDERSLLEIRQLRALDLPIDLGQGLLAAHGQDRMAEGDQDAEGADQAEPMDLRRVMESRADGGVAEPAERVFLPAGHFIDLRLSLGVDLLREVGRGRGEVLGIGAGRQGRAAPGDDDDAHHGRRRHDPQGLVGRLAEPSDVGPPEVEGDGRRDRRRAPTFGNGEFHLEVGEHFVRQADQVLPGRDPADRAGQDVVEQQGRHRESGRDRPHRLLHDPVDPAPGEHRAALDVDAPHGVAEQHDRQDEPRGGLADLGLDDPADVIRGARQVAEDHGRRPPVRHEGQHHRGDDQDPAGRDRRPTPGERPGAAGDWPGPSHGGWAGLKDRILGGPARGRGSRRVDPGRIPPDASPIPGGFDRSAVSFSLFPSGMGSWSMNDGREA